jgi:hypothetical protein
VDTESNAWRNSLATWLLFLGLAFSVYSCGSSSATIAERCVLVDLQQEAGRELLPALERFAQENDLVADLSHPIAPRFHKTDSGTLVAEISYGIGMGEFGAVLSLYRFNRESSVDLLQAFDVFVDRTSTELDVTPCAEVEGFQTPVTYR